MPLLLRCTVGESGASMMDGGYVIAKSGNFSRDDLR